MLYAADWQVEQISLYPGYLLMAAVILLFARFANSKGSLERHQSEEAPREPV